MADTKLVQMRFRPRTMAKIEILKGLLQTSNRTSVIRTAISVAAVILPAVASGHTIILEKGKERQIVALPCL